jgi:predicted MPP superfamily phosphohydrolase
MFGMVTSATSRRAFLAGAGVFILGAAADAFVVEPNWLEITRHEVQVEGLPRALDGFTIAHMTDVHLRSISVVEEAIIRAMQSESVQLVVLTGDIVESTSSFSVLREFCAALRKQGTTIIATLGNWEHWGRVPVEELNAAYGASGIRLLVNEAMTVSGGVRVYGTDDSTAGNPRVKPLQDGPAATTVVLTHSPAFLDRVAIDSNAFALALAGHTHGGQLRLGPRVVPFRPGGSGSFTSGWYATRGGRAYVSRGTGTSIMPARFTCRPELPIFRLCHA